MIQCKTMSNKPRHKSLSLSITPLERKWFDDYVAVRGSSLVNVVRACVELIKIMPDSVQKAAFSKDEKLLREIGHLVKDHMAQRASENSADPIAKKPEPTSKSAYEAGREAIHKVGPVPRTRSKGGRKAK